MAKLLVLYYSAGGHTRAIAEAIAEGARSGGAQAEVREVGSSPVDALLEAGGFCLGTPTYFSNIAWPVKKFIDESITLYRGRKLQGKVAGIFTSTGTLPDGAKCLQALEWALGHHQVELVLPGLALRGAEAPSEVARRGQEYGKGLALRFKGLPR